MRISNLGLRLGVLESIGVSRGINPPDSLDGVAYTFAYNRELPKKKESRFDKLKPEQKQRKRRFLNRASLVPEVNPKRRFRGRSTKMLEMLIETAVAGYIHPRRFSGRSSGGQFNGDFTFEFTTFPRSGTSQGGFFEKQLQRLMPKQSHPGFRKMLLKAVRDTVVDRVVRLHLEMLEKSNGSVLDSGAESLEQYVAEILDLDLIMVDFLKAPGATLRAIGTNPKYLSPKQLERRKVKERRNRTHLALKSK